MRHYKPSVPFCVAMKLLTPTVTRIKGTDTKVFSDPEDSPQVFGSFRTFGGSETTENNLHTVIDTGTVETWYRPDIKPDCRFYMCETGEVYEIIGRPENINGRNQYLRIRVQAIGGTP